jgi:hypothetical protein
VVDPRFFVPPQHPADFLSDLDGTRRLRLQQAREHFPKLRHRQRRDFFPPTARKTDTVRYLFLSSSMIFNCLK